MRILIWTQYDTSSLGGVEVFTRVLASGLLRAGHDVRLLVERGSTDACDDPRGQALPIHRLPFHEALSTRSAELIGTVLGQVRALKRSFAPDVVHLNATDGAAFFHLRTPASCPTVLALHGLMTCTPAGWPLYRALARGADAIVVPSACMAVDARALLADSGAKVRVIEHGLPVPDVPTFPASGEPPTFAFLGRLVPGKGLDLGIEACRLMKQRGRIVRLKVVGAGPCRADCQTRVSDAGLADRVTFAGGIQHDGVTFALSGTSGVIVPSRVPEAFALAAVDAALASRPVIASRSGALAEIVVDGETGLLVPPCDPEAVADALACLSDNPDLAARMGRAARTRALLRYSSDRMVSDYVKLYEALSSPSMARPSPVGGAGSSLALQGGTAHD